MQTQVISPNRDRKPCVVRTTSLSNFALRQKNSLSSRSSRVEYHRLTTNVRRGCTAASNMEEKSTRHSKTNKLRMQSSRAVEARISQFEITAMEALILESTIRHGGWHNNFHFIFFSSYRSIKQNCPNLMPQSLNHAFFKENTILHIIAKISNQRTN